MNVIRIATFGAIIAFTAACQTSGKEVVHYDKKEGAVYVYSARDSRSIMPKASGSAAIKNEADRLKAKLRGNPDDVGTMVSLARLFVARGDLNEADVIARRILSRDFENRQAKIVLAQVAYMQEK